MSNKLFYGDNLDVLRESVADESVDLIYLDPPCNSYASYNVLFKAPGGERSQAQIEAFDDTWHWNESAERAFDEVLRGGHSEAAIMLRAMRSALGENDMMAYLAMMAVRLIELHRALKPTGSLYLHCDPTASHYLKLIADSVFGPKQFSNEIIWKRSSSHNRAKRWGPVHDVILYYTSGEKHTWNRTFSSYDDEYLESKYRHVDAARVKFAARVARSVARRGNVTAGAEVAAKVERNADVARPGRVDRQVNLRLARDCPGDGVDLDFLRLRERVQF
jgi:site-specific DNA-methyltransferase (adenine-specific)